MTATAAAAAPSINPQVQQLFAAAMERQGQGDAQGAFDLYVRVLEQEPFLPDAYNNLAILLKAQRRLPAAVACLERAVQLAPETGAFWSNLGNLLWMSLRFDEAMAAFRRALALEPDRHETHHNLGLLQFSLGDFAAAVESYDRALALTPGARLVRWDRALALLASGDLAAGFAAYDARFDLDDPTMNFDPLLRQARALAVPLWQGEDLSGKTLFVYAEQGHGDTLQFARFLPLAAARGARVIFACAAELARLMASVPGIAELRVLAPSTPLPPADFQLPLMSLPGRLGVTLATLPNAVPYLAPPLAVVGPGVPRPRGTRLAVGIAWAGRPEHSNDANRSMALEDLLRLADLPGIALYSLQVGARAGDIAKAAAAPLISDFSPQIADFADTARLVEQLDLVICIDTALAHLAGALGRPCFVLLPFTADWRWLGGREDSPWYPSLRLFRQPAPRDWASVIARVRETLAALLAAP